MTRYRVEVGWRDGVKPGNLVGAIANEAGIDGSDIGPINIENAFSTVDLPQGMPSDIYHTLCGTWVSGKKLQLSVASADEARGESSQPSHRKPNFHSGKSHGGKPRSGKPGGGKFSGGKGGPKAGKKPFVAGKAKKQKTKG